MAGNPPSSRRRHRSARLKQPEEFEWKTVGATAQCRRRGVLPHLTIGAFGWGRLWMMEVPAGPRSYDLAWASGILEIERASVSVEYLSGGGRGCHRHCKCPVDSCAGCHRSRWLLSNPGCLKRQTPSMDASRCVPNPEHSRAELSIGISIAHTLCAGVFLITRIDGLESLAAGNRRSDPGGRAAGSGRCLSTVACRTRCFEGGSGVHSYSHTGCHGCGRTTCGIRGSAPRARRVFPWSGCSVGGLDRTGSPVSICPSRRLSSPRPARPCCRALSSGSCSWQDRVVSLSH